MKTPTIPAGGSCTITQSVTATTDNVNNTTTPAATGPVSLTLSLDRPERFETTAVDDRELLIRDLSVVEDCQRTTWGPCPIGTKVNAAWTFGRLMEGLAGTTDPATLSNFVLRWLSKITILSFFMTPLVFLLAHRFPLRRGHLARAIPIHFVAALLLCVAWAGLGLLFRALLQLDPVAWRQLPYVTGVATF